MTINNQQSTKNKGSKKAWFQSWMLKATRAFGLDVVPGSKVNIKTWFQNWMLGAISYRGTEQTVGTLRSASTTDKNRAPAPEALAVQRAPLAGRLMRSESRGDTIVEVILATALIASAITLTYSMSNHNLSNGVSAGQRSQALSLAGAQIERIKNAYLTDSIHLATYKINKAFCILSDGSEEDVAKLNSKCANFGGSPYSVTVNYSSTTLVFKADISWFSSSNNSGQDQLTLYYKLPG
ncbi:MAG: hypothetical protein Q7R60_03510 [bacterium]|nr:hypothetical protein [bacterium]